MAFPTPSEILQIAGICQFLAADDERKQTFFKGGFLRKGLSLYIFMVRKGVQWLFDTFPNDPSLVQKCNYLLWLCTPYIAQANAIIAGGGTGTIVNPSTGTESTVTFYYTEFTVGDPDAPILDGESSFVIPLAGFIVNSISGDIGGAELPMFRTDQYSFNVDYSNPAQITITFNAAVSNGMFFQFRGARIQAVVPPTDNTSETFIVVETYADYVAQATGSFFKKFLVKNDENKGDVNIEYNYWPNEVVNWNIVVEETDLNP